MALGWDECAAVIDRVATPLRDPAPGDPYLATGDSDSIACLAGSFAGVSLGLAARRAAWQTRIEYADRPVPPRRRLGLTA